MLDYNKMFYLLNTIEKSIIRAPAICAHINTKRIFYKKNL